MYATTVNNFTNINKTNDYISPQIIEHVEKLCVIFVSNLFSPHLKYVKYLSGLRVMETHF